ncbi:TetR family transcriptional regulator [Streptomyces sp. WZ.A104]|uniref:TetR/AcrR family transcriptional regulator n=1 Tax=Streptomyces sp. WZ.A104 TaxID=2023771 RepID=UPI000BBBF2C4|nr:TetR/AcrR family transcriptional regulator [Streptomyces sp. WZ.A104]PCG86967.1 TetR family transcriptional regulator [Streptomyces sp. WZ.A104]
MPDVRHFDPDTVLEAVVRLFWEKGVAATGIQDVVGATGLSRSSLYATFGGKHQLYLAALERYTQQSSTPFLRRLAEDGRGLPAVFDFFCALIDVRCAGEYARWGCMISNAYVGAENTDADVRAVLEYQHGTLRNAMRSALATARSKGQLHPGADVEASADLLALVAHGVNLRSRAGVNAPELRRVVTAAMEGISSSRRSPAGFGDT